MENGAIADYQITASSRWDKYHVASRARLNIKLSGNMKGGWSARTMDLKQWLQVDLGSYTIVTRVATQGRNGHDQWVTKYRLLYAGNDAMNFHSYKELGDTSAKVSLLSINSQAHKENLSCHYSITVILGTQRESLRLLRTFAGVLPSPPGKNSCARHFKGKHGKLYIVRELNKCRFQKKI